MDADQLAETTMDPLHAAPDHLRRRRRRRQRVQLLMGSEVAPRKEFIVQGAYEVDAEAIDA